MTDDHTPDESADSTTTDRSEPSGPPPRRLERVVLMALLLAPAFWVGLWHSGDIVETVWGLRRIQPHETIAIAYWAVRAAIFGGALWFLHRDRSGLGGLLYLSAIGYPTIVEIVPGEFTGIVVPALLLFFGGLWGSAYVAWRKLVEGLERRGASLNPTGRYGLLGILLVATTGIGVGSYSLVRTQMVEVDCDRRHLRAHGPALGCSRTPVVDEVPFD